MGIEKLKAYLETIGEPQHTDEGFNPDDIAGGKIDDAYYGGYDEGERVQAKLLRTLLAAED